MNKLMLAGVLSFFASIVHAELPDMCYDGTYAGGDECELIIDGEKVNIGIVPDDFFKDEAEIAEELSEIYKKSYGKMDPKDITGN